MNRSVLMVLAVMSLSLAKAGELPFELDGIRFLSRPVRAFQADGRWKYAREPLLTRLSDGSLYCALYSGGEQEPGPDNVVIAVRSGDGGASWSAPEIVLRHPGRATWATEIFDLGEGPELIFQTFLADRWYAELRPYRSPLGRDGGVAPRPSSFHGVPPNFSVRQGLRLSDGSLLFPIYWQENRGAWTDELKYPKGVLDWNGFRRERWRFVSGVIRSSDGGRTWQVRGALGDADRRSVWEPCVVELENGHLRLYARVSGDGAGVLWAADSHDFGNTWGELRPTDIENPDTKPVVFRVGRQVVLLTNARGAGWFDRRRLEAWVSDDLAKTWRRTAIAEASAATNAVSRNFICYPSVLVDGDRRELDLMLDGKAGQYFLRVGFDALTLE